MKVLRIKAMAALVFLIMLSVNPLIFNQNTEGTNSVSNNISSNMDIIGRFAYNYRMKQNLSGSFVENLGQFDSDIYFTSSKGDIAFCPDRILYNRVLREQDRNINCEIFLKIFEQHRKRSTRKSYYGII